MSDIVIVDFLDMDFSKLSFSDKKENKYGSTNCFILYDNKIPYIKFPKLVAPFGISALEDKTDPSKINYSLSLSLDNKTANSQHIEIYNKALQFDECMKKNAIKYQKKWFPKIKTELNFDSLSPLYVPFVKTPTDKKGNELEYSSTIRCAIYADKSNNFSFDLYNEKKEKINLTTFNYMNYINSKDQLSFVLHPRQVWFTGQFGVIWVLKQAKLYKRNELIKNCLLNDSDEENEENENDNYISDDENL